jgi:HK97 family phage portal protein
MGIVQQIRDRLGYVDFSAPADKSTSAPPESKGLPQLIGGTPLDFGRVWLGQSLEVDELTRYTAYAYSVYAYAAMQYRAAKIAEPPLWVAQETDEGEEWIRDHDLQLLLEEPNPDMDMGQLRALTSMYLDIDGEALWHKVRDNGGRVRMLYPYSRSQFDVQPGEVDGVSRIWGKFTISHASGSRVYDANDVVYFRDASPTIGQQVTSRLDAALNWANIGQRTEVALKEALRRGVMPFAVFSYPPDYNPDEETRQKNRETLETRYGGAENHGRPLMLYGGLTAQFANVDLSSLLPEPVLDRVEANVALALGVRPEVLGYLVGLKNSPWSHMDTARKITYEDTIEPYWRREEKALTRQLLPLPERQARRFIRVDSSGVRALQDDEMARARIAAMNRDIWTEDEARIYTGKEPHPENPDEAVEAQVGLNGAQVTAAIEVLRRLRTDEEGERISHLAAVELLVAIGIDRARAESMVAASPERGGGAKQRKAADSERDQKWREFDLAAKAQEPEWARGVSRLLSLQASDIDDLFRRFVTAEGGVPDEQSIERFVTAVREYLGEEGAAIARAALQPLVTSTATAAARRLTGRLGIGFDVVQRGLTDYIAEELDFLLSVMEDTTARAVAEAVQSAMVDRVPMRELQSRLEGLDAFDRSRALLVARTETTRAANGAQRRVAQAYQQETGRAIEKSWLSSRDDRVRDEHEQRDDGEWYGIDHEWGGLKEPGEPNCRCTMTYRFAPEAGQ